MLKFIGNTGLAYLWSKIKNYVANAISDFYSKPSGGIPKTDLANAVQTSLEKADSAVQTESDPVFVSSAAHGITSSDISSWNGKQDAVSNITNLGGVSLSDYIVFNVNSKIKGINLSHLKKMLTSEYNYNDQFDNATFNYEIPSDGRCYGPRYSNRNYEGKVLSGVRLCVSAVGYGKVVVVHNIFSDASVTTTDYDVYSIYTGQIGIQDVYLQNDVLLNSGDMVLVGSDGSKTYGVDKMVLRYAFSNATGCQIGFASFSLADKLEPNVSSSGFIGVDLIVKESDSIATVYTGTSAPTSNVGSSGDIYIQTT